MIRAARAVGGTGDSGDALEGMILGLQEGVFERGDLPPQTLAWVMAEALACSWISLSAMVLLGGIVVMSTFTESSEVGT